MLYIIFLLGYRAINHGLSFTVSNAPLYNVHVYSFCKSKTESKVSLSKFYGPQVKHDKQYMYFSQRIKRYGFINISGTLIFVDFAVEGILKIPSINHQNQMSLALSVLLIVNSF